MTTPARILLAAAVAAAFAAGCGPKAEKKPVAPAGTASPVAADEVLLAPTDVAAAARLDLATGVPVSGTLAAGWEAQITSPFDDVVEDVLVREGQRVAKGQVLARFRHDTVTPAAASAAARLKSAAADHERQKNLLAEGAVSQRDLEAAEAAWRAAQAEAAAADKRLADATVRAPGSGSVTARHVQAGSRVGAGDPLFVVADTREVEFEASVPSEHVRLVRPGAAVRLEVTGFESGTIHGRVARVNAQADPATRQVKVYVTVPNGETRLVAGLFASGHVLTQEARKVLAVPSAAVRREGDRTYAWVIEAGRLDRRTLRTGLRDESRDLVEVLDGLGEGASVVVGPVEGFAPGRPARVSGRES
jgi:RND family efflux transporter MFP subunit